MSSFLDPTGQCTDADIIHSGAIDDVIRGQGEGRIAPSQQPVRESDFLPTNVLPMSDDRREQKKAAKLAANPTRVAVKGGKRIVRVKVNIPIEQYAGLQRFEGESDSEKINAIIRMANRRVDKYQREQMVSEESAPT